jgi:serine/threonine-protein kinase
METTDGRSPLVHTLAGRALEPGQLVGVYEVAQLLGAGGMGEVYRARDTRLGRDVAIKVVRGGAAGAGDLLAEAQAMAKLSHRNVVTVYEAGALGAEVYLAMEYVDGQTLRGWLESRPRPWREITACFVAAGRGLAAAHAAGIVHRDFKPENVLVGRDGRVCVSDFGLAAAVAGDGPTAAEDRGAAPIRFSIALAGTPAYMAPEQHRREDVDARADQFAFCVALYEALAGERPFPGTTLAEIRASVLGGEPVRPPPGVPSWLRAAVLRGLARDRASRFVSMEALLQAIDRDPAARRRRVGVAVALLATSALGVAGLMQRRPSAPVCDGGGDRVARVWNPAIALAVRGALVGTGRPYAPGIADRAVAALDRYAGAWSAMHRDACEASLVRHEQSAALLDLRMACLDRRLGALGALAVELARRPDEKVLGRAPQAVADLDPLPRCADAAALAAAVPPPDDPAVRASVAALRPRLDRAAAIARAGGTARAVVTARELIADARAIPYDATLAEALYDAALLSRGASETDLTESALREGLVVAARAHEDTLVVAMWGDLMAIVGLKGRTADALAMLPAAETAIARAGDPRREHGRVLNGLGSIYVMAGRNAEAADAFRRALGYVDDDNLRVISENNLGTALLGAGRLDEAAVELGHARDLAAEVYGADSPWVASVLINLGTVQQQEGRLDDARQSLTRARAVCERALGARNATCAKADNNLGYIEQMSGRLDEAAAAYRRALAVKEEALGPEHPDTLNSVENLAQVHLLLGRYAEADALSRRVVAAREKVLGPDNVALVSSLTPAARIAAAEGDLGRARAAATRALAIAEKTTGKESVASADPHAALAEVDLAEGRYADAATEAERAVASREHGETDPHALADARLLLARTLRRRDPARADELARAARAEYVAEGERGASRLAEVDRFLAR